MAIEGAQEVTVTIDAPRTACFETITDFERYPEWSKSIRTARVREHDAHGIGRSVEFHLDLKVRTIRFVLEYTYRKPRELEWEATEGDVESLRGRYTFHPLGRNRTEATCRQELRAGFWIPGPLRRFAEQRALEQSVDEFKAEAERRVARPARKPSRRK